MVKRQPTMRIEFPFQSPAQTETTKSRPTSHDRQFVKRSRKNDEMSLDSRESPALRRAICWVTRNTEDGVRLAALPCNSFSERIRKLRSSSRDQLARIRVCIYQTGANNSVRMDSIPHSKPASKFPHQYISIEIDRRIKVIHTGPI